MDAEKLLLAEYTHYSELLWKNEEAGERRVSFFITLVTAVITAMVALWTSTAENQQRLGEGGALPVTIGALIGLALFGVVTFLRILQRDHVTDEYKGILDYIRTQLRHQAPGLSEYDLPFRKGRPPLLKGGLALTVAVMNMVIVGLLGWEVRLFNSPWLCAMSGMGIVLLSHFPFIVKRKKTIRKLNSEYFRAGVGAVIYKADGLVLVLERSDIPGSWQLPQGGVERGETLEQALFREIKEETGLIQDDLTICLEVPTWMGYELPQDARSKKTGRGQVHKWFFLKFVGNEGAVNLQADGEFRDFRWQDLSELVNSAIEFRRPVYSLLLAVAVEKVWRSA